MHICILGTLGTDSISWRFQGHFKTLGDDSKALYESFHKTNQMVRLIKRHPNIQINHVGTTNTSYRFHKHGCLNERDV